jgi:hypothetical protein
VALPSIELHNRVRKQIRQAKLFLTDTDYEIPTHDWIGGKFYNLYRNWLWKNNRERWTTYSDCDNFAFMFMVFANLCHAKTMDARKKLGQKTYQGIAVGVVFYMINGDNTRGHAINFIHTDKGIEFLEPQDGSWVKLTDKERASAWFAVC